MSVLMKLVAAVVSLLAGTASAGAVSAGGNYAALGDSYTAGPVIPNQLPDPPGCMRSDHDYPHLLAAARSFSLHDVSCSGAATSDMASPQPVSGGPNPPQLDALAPDTGVVTLSIGGNDIGFSEIVRDCIALFPLGSPCHDRYVGPGGDEISARIAATAPRVAAVLDEVRRRAPAAAVYVVGYPAILPDAGIGCWPVMPFAVGDLGWLRDKEKELNAMLQGEASAHGAAYVDTYGPSIGHDACALPGQRWVEPIVPTSPAAPVHPNALGMAGVANVVAAAIPPG